MDTSLQERIKIVDARMDIDSQNETLKLKQELNDLRPKPLLHLLYSVLSILGVHFLCAFMEVSTEDSKIYSYAILAIVFVQGMIFTESRRINKRIDILAKLMGKHT